MNIGVDIGYNAVKVYNGRRTATFQSVVGTADVSRFTAGGVSPSNFQLIELCDGSRWMYGTDALEMSRIVSRPENRAWYNSREYHVLLTAAFRDILHDVPVQFSTLNVVTGLPVMFYEDKDELQQIMLEPICFKNNGEEVVYNVNSCRIIPQPFGTLLNLALDQDGDIQDAELARGMIGVVDCGGKTTNVLTASKMREVARLTTSVGVGGWDIVRAVRDLLNTRHPELDMRDSQIVDSIVSRKVRLFGKDVSIEDLVDTATRPFADTIIAVTTQLWNSGALIDRIILTGGASVFIHPFIKEIYPHVTIASDPIFSNVIGYYKFANRIFKGAT